MAQSEDDLIRRLREGKASAPPGEDDQLWAAISGKLPAAESAAPNARFWPWLLGIAGLLLLTGGFYAASTSSPEEPELTITSTTPPLAKEKTSRTTNVANSDFSLPAQDRSTAASVTEEEPVYVPDSAPSSGTSLPGRLPRQAVHPRPRPETAPAISPPAELATLTRLAPLAIFPLEVPPVIPDRAIITPETEVALLDRPRNWAYELHGGTVVVNESFAGGPEDLGQRLTTATAPTFGQRFGISVYRRVGKGWSVGTGLAYTRSHTLLDYTAEFDTVAPHPGLPDRTTRAVGRYQVTHNNHLGWLSVPLTLRYEKAFGRTLIGLSGGLRLNYTLTATGKTLATDGFARSFTEPSGEVKPWHLSYGVRPSLAWPLRQDSPWHLQLSSGIERLDFGPSATSLTTRRAWAYSFQIGVIYR